MANQTARHRDGFSDAPSAGFRSMSFRNWYFKYRYNGYVAPDNENRQQGGFRMRLTSFTDFGPRALMRIAGEPDRSRSTAAIATHGGAATP